LLRGFDQHRELALLDILGHPRVRSGAGESTVRTDAEVLKRDVFGRIVATKWPRERDSRIVSDPRFGEITERLWTSLREESLRAMGLGKWRRRQAVSAITSNGSTSTVPPLARLVASV
jgi:hypothetical protein